MSRKPNNLIPESVPANPDDGRELPTVFTNRFTVHIDGPTVRIAVGETFAINDPKIEWRGSFLMSLENFRNLVAVSTKVIDQVDRQNAEAGDQIQMVAGQPRKLN